MIAIMLMITEPFSFILLYMFVSLQRIRKSMFYIDYCVEEEEWGSSSSCLLRAGPKVPVCCRTVCFLDLVRPVWLENLNIC